MIDTKLYELVDEAKMKACHIGREHRIVVNAGTDDSFTITIDELGNCDRLYPYKDKFITSYQIKYATNFNIIYVVL